MSFLGYIGKTLGAGTAPIVNANAASQSDIQYREFRDNAPNREELTRISMEEARRAERIARDRELERQRGQAVLKERREAGLPTFDMGVIPNISATAPTTLKPAPAAPAAVTEEVAPPKPDKVVSEPDFYGSLADTPTVDEKTARRLRVLNAQIDRSNARLAEIPAERDKLQRQYAGLGAAGSPRSETRQKLKALDQETATLTAGIKSIQSEVDLFVTGQKIARAAPPPLAAQVGQDLTDMRPAVTPAAAPAAAPVTAPAAPPAAGLAPPAAAPAVAPAAAPAAPALAGYEQFRPAVETVAPQLGFSLDEANTLMAGLGYGEGRFNADAKSPSGTFTGAYQLSPANINQYGPRVQQRFGYSPTSPEGQAAMALMFAADNKKTLVVKGIEPTPPNLALAHNQGAVGAAALLQNPSMLVAEALDKFAPEKNSGSKRASGQAWMKGQDVTKTTAGEFVERASAYYGKYSPEFSNPKSFPINPDIYLGDPNGLTFDMRQAEFIFNLSKQRQEDILNLIDASDPFSDASQEQLADAYTISERLVQQSGVYTQLQITKGLTSAYGGDTSYLNGVLSGVMDYPIEVTAEAGEQGIAYRITAGGQPVSDSLSYDQMKQFTMRMADSQYDAELAALELAAAAKTNEILAQGKVDLDLAKYKAGADAILAALNAQFEMQGRGTTLTKLTETLEGKVLVTDDLGQVYEVTTSRQKIGGKMQDITSLELIEVEELSE